MQKMAPTFTEHMPNASTTAGIKTIGNALYKKSSFGILAQNSFVFYCKSFEYTKFRREN